MRLFLQNDVPILKVNGMFVVVSHIFSNDYDYGVELAFEQAYPDAGINPLKAVQNAQYNGLLYSVTDGVLYIGSASWENQYLDVDILANLL